MYKFLRARLGDEISDRAIARKLGMEWKSFAALKHGQRQLPRLGDLERIAKLVRVEPLALFQVALGDGTPAPSAARELQARVELVRFPIFTVDLDGVIRDVNPAAATALRRERKALVGRTLLDLVAPDSTSHALALVGTFARGEGAFASELLLQPANASPMLVDLEATALTARGRVVGAQVICRDVTVERRLTRQLNEQRQLLQTMFDRLPAACIVYDSTRTIVAANGHAARVFGAPESEIVGKRQADLFGPAAATCPVTRAFASAAVEHQAATITRADGQRLSVHRTAGPIYDGGRVARVVEIVVDVPSSSDRRDAVRAEVSFSAQLRHGERTELVRVENLSRGGLFVRTATRLTKGAEIELEWLMPPDRRPVRARAVVAWRRPKGREREAGVGVRFLQLAHTSADSTSSTNDAA